MADAKKAAKKAAPSNNTNVTDSQAEKAFAEPDKTDQVQPVDALSPAESLQRDEEKAKAQEELNKVEERQSEAMAEVREKYRDLYDRARFHNRTEVSAVVHGIKDPSDAGANADAQDGPSIGIYSGDGRVTLSIGGNEVVLDREATINLQRQLDGAFQAVA